MHVFGGSPPTFVPGAVLEANIFDRSTCVKYGLLCMEGGFLALGSE